MAEQCRPRVFAGSRYDPVKDILWNQPPGPNRRPATLGAPQTVPAALPDAKRRDLMAQAYPAAYGKAMMESEFPAAPDYGAPVTVLGPGGKPELIQFPKTGGGAPRTVADYRPYEKSTAGSYGDVQSDESGRQYQLGPKNKRHYLPGGDGQDPSDLKMAHAFLKYGVAPDMATALRMSTQQVTKDPNAAYFSLVSGFSRNAFGAERQQEAAALAARLVREVYPEWSGPQGQQAPGPTTEVESPGLLERFFSPRKEAAAAPGGGVTIPLPPVTGDVGSLAAELNTLPDAQKETRLRKLMAEDPETFQALMRFLEGG